MGLDRRRALLIVGLNWLGKREKAVLTDERVEEETQAMNTRQLITKICVIACCVALLAGCGKSEKKEKKREEKDRSARVTMRVDEIRKRIDDVQHSLVQLYQESEIQQAKIRAAQENLQALKKSLGDIMKIAPTMETSGVAMTGRALDIPRLREEAVQAKQSKDSDKKKRENRALDTLLIVVFLAFLATVGYKLSQRKRNASATSEPSSSDQDSYTIIKPPASSQEQPSESGQEQQQQESSQEKSEGEGTRQ